MKNRFYLACFRDNVGSNVSFHCIDGKGYSTNIDKAHIYTLEEAQKEWNSAREYDQPISADHIDAMAKWHVDHQYIPYETVLNDPSNCYVAFKKGVWNGNDVFWLNTDLCTTSNDFETASVIGIDRAEKLDKSYIAIPFHMADSAKRRTFDSGLFNYRLMVEEAGLVMPSRFKKKKKKPSSGKTRWNCPSCGRLSWQFNPHDFMGCRNIKCDEWSANA